ARSTRVLMNNPIPDEPTNSIRPKAAGWHAHDLFLQTWYELGVAGVVLIALAGAAVVLQTSLLPSAARPYAAATFTFFMGIAAFAWDMWQTWLIFAVVLTLLYLTAAATNLERSNQNGQPPSKTAHRDKQKTVEAQHAARTTDAGSKGCPQKFHEFPESGLK